jgi:hypothetical protein
MTIYERRPAPGESAQDVARVIVPPLGGTGLGRILDIFRALFDVERLEEGDMLIIPFSDVEDLYRTALSESFPLTFRNFMWSTACIYIYIDQNSGETAVSHQDPETLATHTPASYDAALRAEQARVQSAWAALEGQVTQDAPASIEDSFGNSLRSLSNLIIEVDEAAEDAIEQEQRRISWEVSASPDFIMTGTRLSERGSYIAYVGDTGPSLDEMPFRRRRMHVSPTSSGERVYVRDALGRFAPHPSRINTIKRLGKVVDDLGRGYSLASELRDRGRRAWVYCPPPFIVYEGERFDYAAARIPFSITARGTIKFAYARIEVFHRKGALHPHAPFSGYDTWATICNGTWEFKLERARMDDDLHSYIALSWLSTCNYSPDGHYFPIWCDVACESCCHVYSQRDGVSDDTFGACVECDREICHDCGTYSYQNEGMLCRNCGSYCQRCQDGVIGRVAACFRCGAYICVSRCGDSCPSCDRTTCQRCVRSCDKCQEIICSRCFAAVSCYACDYIACDDCYEEEMTLVSAGNSHLYACRVCLEEMERNNDNDETTEHESGEDGNPEPSGAAPSASAPESPEEGEEREEREEGEGEEREREEGEGEEV